MKKLLPHFQCLGIIFFLLFSVKNVYATHIVGGEFELQHVQGDTYRLGLILYFDNVSGLPGARDSSAEVFIFSKATNELIQSITLPIISDRRVPYTSPDCAIGSLNTSRLFYQRQIRLRSFTYNDPEGYYVVYERCCRNGSVQNILDPGGAGQAFYLEFPAVVEPDGQPFINSSPQLFPPLSDYACVNQPFQFDFSGSDVDGDSLAYSLQTPFNGYSSRNQPIPDFPQPAPYQPITFLSGYSESAMIPGNPALQIDAKSGFLEVTPAETGLFVFSVKCEEFREGKKIGEVVRDFQMLVIDCPVANSPTVLAKTNRGSLFQTTDTLVFKSGRIDNCLQLLVTDPDDFSGINTRIIPIGVVENDFTITGERNTLATGGDTLVFDFCLNECPKIVNEIYEVKIVVEDNSCSLPLKDTLSIFIKVEEPNTTPNIFSDDIIFDEQTGCYYAEVKTSENINFTVTGDDPDGDPVILSAFGEGFSLEQEGMQFTADSALATVTSTFSWDALCANMEIDEQERIFSLKFVVGDIGICGIKSTDTLCVDLKLIKDPPPNATPELSTDKQLKLESPTVYFDTIRIGEEYVLNIQGFDIDADSIRLEGQAVGTSFSELNALFSDVSGKGSVSSRFFWKPQCSLIPDVEDGATSAIFEFNFVTRDYTDCSLPTTDSLTLFLVVLYEPTIEDAPDILVSGAEFNTSENTFEVTAIAGEVLELQINGSDEENDLLNMRVNAVNFNATEIGMQFSNAAGISPVTSNLLWPTSCDSFNDSINNEFNVEVLIENVASCGIAATDTVTLKIKLEEKQREAVETFPNAFSPDGNGINDSFEILVLPADLCRDRFEFVEVTNRWGDVVFKSEVRDFSWDGDNQPEGTYFYFVKYTNASYKGLVNLLRVTE